MSIKSGDLIQHAGQEAEIIGTATNSETGEKMVVYRLCGSDDNLWACPLTVWEKNRRKSEKAAQFHTCAQTSPFKKTGVHNQSSRAEKTDLFLSLFAGRRDVYAKRWENSRTKKSGYVPHCRNQWTPLCPKTEGKKVKCGKCTEQNFPEFDAQAVTAHLSGELIIGVYPLLQDETCRFLVLDFDAKDRGPKDLRSDMKAFRQVALEKQICLPMERSRSGQGIHLWLFFAEPIPAGLARKLGSSLITAAMDKRHRLSFKTYDRMIPGQDTLVTGGFGNLIALPLQKEPRQRGNSVFIDDNFEPFPDQWQYLDQIKRYTRSEAEDLLHQFADLGEVGDLYREMEQAKPWKSKKRQPELAAADFPPTVEIIRANMLYMEKQGLSNQALSRLKRLAAFHNPEFYKAQAQRRSTFRIPRIISCFKETEEYLGLPRGLDEQLEEFLNAYQVNYSFSDKTNPGRPIDVRFRGKLRPEQQEAAQALLAHRHGVLAAATAFGKTVIGAYCIAQLRVNTLILVHRTALQTQWLNQLDKFLQINEEPPIKLTPTGRKRKIGVIGQIGGGKDRLSGIVDVATLQSLFTENEVKDLVRGYGLIIADECHHISAVSFERIMQAANAKYVFGLTATPTRRDGHHPIIAMQCGKIRHRVDAKEQAEKRPFEHYVIPRFTRFQTPAHLAAGDWTIAAFYREMIHCQPRNELIMQDVLAAVQQGRTPIILTERLEHVRLLTSLLTAQIQNVIALTGGKSRKQSEQALQKLAQIPQGEPLVLVATGKYAGEGFDFPRLDTLFLTMPISWKGNLQQYAGRLHRLYEGKNEVQIYDYVDLQVPRLEAMYQKRLKGYASLGYKAKGTAHPLEKVQTIFDNNTFPATYRADILAAQKSITIASPRLSKNRLLSAVNDLIVPGVQITVITKALENYPAKTAKGVQACLKLLGENGIKVRIKDQLYQRFAVIDGRIVWYGAIDFLGYAKYPQSVLRIENGEIAAELLNSIEPQ